MELPSSPRSEPPRGRGREGRRRQARALELVLARLARRRPRAARGLPGLAKTLLARSFAQARSASPRPVHARPAPGRRDRLVDLQPARRPTSSFAPGRSSRTSSSPTRSTAPRRRRRPRCSRRCRSARSRRTGDTRPLERPFLVLATQNPIEYEGTYPLPEAQLDRFLLRIGFGYPSVEPSGRCWRAASNAGRTRSSSSRSSTRPRSSRCSRRSSTSTSRAAVGRYMVDVVQPRATARASRSARARAALALYKLSRCRAALRGRDFVCPDDVRRSRRRRSATGSRSSPSCGCSACDPTSLPTRSRPLPRPRPRTSSPTPDDTLRLVAARRVRGFRRARPSLRFSWAGRAGRRSRAPFAAFLVVVLEAPPKFTVAHLRRDRALEGEPSPPNWR